MPGTLGAKPQMGLRESLIIAWRLLLHPSCRPAYVAHFAHATASFIAFAWLPTYYVELSKTLGMEDNAATAAARGFSSVMPYVFMVVFSVSGSLLADHLLARGTNRTCALGGEGKGGGGGLLLAHGAADLMPCSLPDVRRLLTGSGYGAASLVMAVFLLLPPSMGAGVLLSLSIGLSGLSVAGARH